MTSFYAKARLSKRGAKFGATLLVCGVAFLCLPQALCVESLIARAQTAGRAKGSINGRVVDESGQPFANAVVSISAVNGSNNDERELITDEDGAFQAGDLAAKAYTVWCSAPGYVEDGMDDSKRYHQTGASVHLRLVKGGVITGTVTNASGARMVNAKVEALRVRDGQGRARQAAEVYDEVTTDDRGVYRFYGFEGGAYLIFVSQTGEVDDKALRNETSVYFPSSTIDDAQEVKVREGQEIAGIDIRHRSVGGHFISGKYSGIARKADSSDTAFLKLIHAKSGAIEVSDWIGDEANRAFVFYGVPDGEYYLMAQDDTDEPTAASLPHRVSVKGSDVTGIELKLLPLAAVAGRVVIENSAKIKCKEARESSPEELAIELKVLRPKSKTNQAQAARFFAGDRSTAPDEKGDFIVRSLFPGPYHLMPDLAHENLYLRSVNAGEKPVNTAAPNLFNLKPGERVSNVNILVAKGAAGLSGQVRVDDEKLKLPSRLHLCLIPSQGDDAWRFFEEEVETDGTFVFKNLAPGSYFVYLRTIDDAESPESLQPAAWNAESRVALRRDAEAAKQIVNLQPCQRLANYALLYPLKKQQLSDEKNEQQAETSKAQTKSPLRVIKRTKKNR
jgi:hypothetical protein